MSYVNLNALEIDHCTCVADKKENTTYCSSLVYGKLKENNTASSYGSYWARLRLFWVNQCKSVYWESIWFMIGECILKQDPVNHMSASLLRHMLLDERVWSKSYDHMSSRKYAYQGWKDQQKVC